MVDFDEAPSRTGGSARSGRGSSRSDRAGSGSAVGPLTMMSPMSTVTGDTPPHSPTGSTFASSRVTADDVAVIVGGEGGGAAVTVLLVDDSRINRRVCKSSLAGVVGLAFDEAKNGALALQKLQEVTEQGVARSWLVMMDISMPVMTGDAAVREYRAWCKGRGIAREDQAWICAFTGDVVTPLDKFLAMGFDGLLTKPVDSAQLRDVIIHQLSLRGSAAWCATTDARALYRRASV